jgi:hypothetical protein
MSERGAGERTIRPEPEGLDLPGPSRRIRVEPLRLPEPARRAEPERPEPAPEPRRAPEPDREPVPQRGRA